MDGKFPLSLKIEILKGLGNDDLSDSGYGLDSNSQWDLGLIGTGSWAPGEVAGEVASHPKFLSLLLFFLHANSFLITLSSFFSLGLV